MEQESLRTELLKHARNAFETACTIRDNRRIEVYLHNGEPRTSDVLEESDELIYGLECQLCYQIYGHDHLEEEIKIWIDYARVIPQPEEGEVLPDPTDIETSIRELASDLAKNKGLESQDISSYEIFANLPVDLLGSIEQQIIEYWWGADEEENAKKLALVQISEAIEHGMA